MTTAEAGPRHADAPPRASVHRVTNRLRVQLRRLWFRMTWRLDPRTWFTFGKAGEIEYGAPSLAASAPEIANYISSKRLVAPSVDAYDLYLRGRDALNRRDPELNSAVSYLREATAIAPFFAPAHAALADCLGVLSVYGLVPPFAALHQAREASERAVELDSDSAESHLSAGLFQLYFGWDWARAEAKLQLSGLTDLSSGLPLAYLSILHAILGKSDELRNFAAYAEEREPFSPLVSQLTGLAFLLDSSPEESRRRSERALELDPSMAAAHFVLGCTHLLVGQREAAIGRLEHALDLVRAPAGLGMLGAAYAESGREADARALLAEVGQFGTRADGRAIVHWALGETDRAIQLYEQAATEHAPLFFVLGVYPGKSAHGALYLDPRWDRLLRRAGLGELALRYPRAALS